MFVHKIELNDFRNFERLEIFLQKGVNVFYGENAQGKTNMLESVYLCATGRSQRARNIKELVRFGGDYANVTVFIKSGYDDGVDKINVNLNADGAKRVLINGVQINKMSELFGKLLAVMFSPEDLKLIKSGPAERRRFMDMELCQLSVSYCHDLQRYYRVLKQRNNLLRSVKYNPSAAETLFLWDRQIVEIGIEIIKKRRAFISDLSDAAAETHSRITNGTEKLKISYKPNVTEDDFEEKLKRNKDRDIFLAATASGVHKDDLSFEINGFNAKVYGSQGQQRTACLCAKLAEISVIKNQKKRSPVLLLDDVFSELDETRRRFLIKNIEGVQSIITSAGAVEANVFKNALEVKNGKIYRGV
ncbi:MAG: DNA replication/repair protein RecF [Clostridiales bacterium]|jgi:DNA replication and repair protein RecF|nr:DNA replication/repair protein RecF [Clostridiales bacterium]